MATIDKQYFDLVNQIIENGTLKDSRAGKTKSIFGYNIKYNLKEGLPLLTTKKVFSKGCLHELLWFIKGDTNIKYLVENNVHIWDDDAYRYYRDYICQFLKFVDDSDPYSKFIASKDHFLSCVLQDTQLLFNVQIGPHGRASYRFGDLGPVYGNQWTNWNDSGLNQLKNIENTLRNNPDDRRLILSAWNPEMLRYMALPPCHYSCQFYTRKLTLEERLKLLDNGSLGGIVKTHEALDELNIPKRALSCMWQQRSVDVILGLPFNLLSYAILTHMLAQCVNMIPETLIFNGGDCHIYENQIEIFQSEQMCNPINEYDAPQLWLNPEIKNINDFTIDDIKIVNYQSFPAIKYPLSTGL